MRELLYGILLIASCTTVAWAGNPPAPAKPDAGFESSIEGGTQLVLGKLGIGFGGAIRGPYIDEKGVHQYGIYGGLDITVDDDPSAFRQVDVHEGETLTVAGYRILIERIIPAEKAGERDTVILRVWVPK